MACLQKNGLWQHQWKQEMMKKVVGPHHCPLVTVDSATKPSAAIPAETRSDWEDETKAEKTKRFAMAAQASITQGQRPPQPSTPVVLAHPRYRA